MKHIAQSPLAAKPLDGFGELFVTRIPAVTVTPAGPRSPGDRRSQHLTETVEAEAMPAHVLRHLLHERALKVARIEEEAARAHVDRMAEMFGRARP